MSIGFENGVNVLLWSFAKSIVTFEAKRYLFAAQCTRWISAIIGSQLALVHFIDNQRFPSESRMEESQPPLVSSRCEPITTELNQQKQSFEIRIDQVLDRAENSI